MRNIRVLMTGAGAPGASGIIKCYRHNDEREIFILGVDAKDTVSTETMLDTFCQIPKATDNRFVDELLSIAKKNKIDVIQPLVTKELDILADNIELFNRNGISVCVNTSRVLDIANDKGKLLKELAKNNIDVPKFKLITKGEDFEEACKQIGYPNNSVCFKPTKANGSRGFRVIDDKVSKADLLFNQKPNSTYIDFSDAVRIFHGLDSIPELLVMEFMPGEEYSIDMLVNKGNTLYAIPRRRDNMVGGISTDCTVCFEEDVINYAVKVAKLLSLEGNVGIQVRRDVNGCVKMLEINPRVQGSIVCCAAAGVNLPYFGIKYHLGEEIKEVPIQWGTRMIRHWEEEYYDTDGRPFTY